MVDFTVAIPTYNGASRLKPLLDSLRSQTGTEQLAWEVIVVDNNSSDETAELIRRAQEEWGDTYPRLKYVFEPIQGAAHARQQAMRSTQSAWVGFLDDDIIPSEDWVAAAYQFCQAHPDAGAFGGQIHGKFEIPPPDNFKRIQSFLAIRERGKTAHLYQPEQLILPPSAAWVINRQAWQAAVPAQPKLRGRTKGSVVQGDDYEPLIFMHKAGYHIWYNPEMHVQHQIPKQRLEPSYLIGLSRGCGLCIYTLRQMMADTPQQRFTVAFKVSLGNLRRAILHLLKYQQAVFSDLVTRCEMEFFISGSISPIYHLLSYRSNNSMPSI